MKILKNNYYIMRICIKAAPLYICMSLLNCVMGYTINTVISVYFMKFIVEAIQREYEFLRVLGIIFSMFAVGLISKYLSAFVKDILQPVGQVKITSKFMEMLYQQAMKVDLSCYEDPQFYDSYTKANERVEKFANEVVSTLTSTAGLVISLGITVTAIIKCEPQVIFFAIFPVVVQQLITKKYTEYKYNRDKDTAYERRQIEYVNRIVYLIDYAKEIRLSHIFTPIMRSFERAIENSIIISKDYGKKIGIMRFLRTILSELIVYLGVQSLIAYQYLVKSAYSLGNLTVLLNSVSEFTSQLGELTRVWNQVYESGIFVDNFRIFMEYKPKITENLQGDIPEKGGIDARHMEIVFSNVGFLYEGSTKPVLKNINLKIKKGEKIAIVGHNGAGKTTFVKLLLRLYDVTEGSISVGGTDIRKYRLSEYRKLFGTVFQDFKIFAATAVENVLLRKVCNEDDEEKAAEALKTTGIYEKIFQSPNGLDSQLTKEFDKKGMILSGGENQKLAIARLFAKDNEICIMDEPSSALDPLSEAEVFQNMYQVCKGKTVIFISHRLATTIMADRIYLFENGSIVESGNHEELMQLDGKYAQMYRMQAKQYQEAAYEN